MSQPPSYHEPVLLREVLEAAQGARRVVDATLGGGGHAAAFVEAGAQVLGISCDHAASHRAWATALGGLPYPELSDWEPKGQVSRAYGLWNSERGASQRAVLIIDKEGVVRYRRTYSAPNLPDLEEIVRELQQLGGPPPKA